MSDERQEAMRRVRELLGEIVPTMPRYRYFQTRDRWMFCWTTVRVTDKKGRPSFAAFVYRPIGTGARSGCAEQWKLQRVSHRRKRSDARDLAKRWFERHKQERARRDEDSGDVE